MSKILNFDKWNSSIDENAKYQENSFNKWKRIYEQEVGKKKEKQVDNLEKELGITESQLLDEFIKKINEDTGEKKNLMGKIKDDNIKAGIVETFIYSSKTPKDFYKDPESFKFKALPISGSQSDKWPRLSSVKDKNKIPYVNTDGEFMEATYDQIISDINLKNTDNYAEKKNKTQYRLKKISDSKKTYGARYYFKATSVETFGLLVISPGKFQPTTTSKMEGEGTTTTVTPGKEATTKVLKFNIKLDTNEGSGSGVEFVVGKSAVIGDASGTVYAKLKEQAAKQGIEDLSTLKITKFTVISSASNQWGGKVTATHNNAGKPTGAKYTDPASDNPNWNAQNATKNYNLANQRGTNLGNTLLPGLKEKGISEIANPTVSPRVTDTGGVNDNKRNKSTHPNAGQFAQLVIEASVEGKEEIVTPATPETEKSTIVFTQFKLILQNTAGSGSGLAGFRNIGLSKAKYLKKNGGWKSKGYIKRHGGGNRPVSGLAGWFDGLFYSGV